MDDTLNNYSIINGCSIKEDKCIAKNLSQAIVDQGYVIKGIETNDAELKNFLLTLGCYQGEIVTVISKLGENYIINIKDARYGIDEELAQAIIV